VRHITADPTRADQLLGYRAQVPFAEGIARFATDPLREPVTTW
jgi:dTDP-L-rhamnose 4-epimerase